MRDNIRNGNANKRWQTETQKKRINECDIYLRY